MTLEQGCRHLQVARLAGMHFPQNLPPVPASCSSRCPRGCTWQVIMTWWTRLTPVMRVFRHAMQHRWLTAPMDDMSDPTRTRLRLRFVYKHYVAPVGLSHADAAGSSISILKDSICPVLEERAGEKLDVDNMTLLYNEKPLRDVNGSALNGVPDMALIDCIVVSHAAEAEAASQQAAQAEAQHLANIDDVNASVDDLEQQVEEGGFIGKDMQLLEALERQLYRLDGIRAASGYKLSPQVMGARKASIRRINDLERVFERQMNLASAEGPAFVPTEAAAVTHHPEDGTAPGSGAALVESIKTQ